MLQVVKIYILVILGSISLALGIIGIFLPILPTTPFLLLTSYLYFRSSKRLYYWLLSQRVLGLYIYNYINYRAVLLSTKIFSLIFLWTSLVISIILTDSTHIRVFLLVVGICVTIHLHMLKTIKKADLINFSSESGREIDSQTQ